MRSQRDAATILSCAPELEKLPGPNDGVARQIDGILVPVGGAREMTGQRVGPYEVAKILGQGGMGVVCS